MKPQKLMPSLELQIFPQSKYALPILYAVLRESLVDSPGEATRFSQGLFDAIGDLGVRKPQGKQSNSTDTARSFFRTQSDSLT